MNEIANNNNPLWFLEESNELLNYSEGSIAERIFSMADKKMARRKTNILMAVADKVPAVIGIGERHLFILGG